MKSELYEDVERIVNLGAGHGYRVGHATGYKQGFDEAMALKDRARIETLILVGAVSAVGGILLGIGLGMSA